MKKNHCDFPTYMASLARSLRRQGRFGTAHVYEAALRRVLHFSRGRPLPFSRVDREWLLAFQNYLLERQLRWNSVSTYLRMLRAAYLRAVDAGLAPFRPRLFRGVFTGNRADCKRALTSDVLRRLRAVPLADPALERARQLFLLLFMLRGIPFVDIAYLRRCDLRGDVLSYRRRKTGAPLRVRVEPPALEALRRLQSPDPASAYLFPFVRSPGERGYRQYRSALRCFNRRLKALADAAGCRMPLSSYCARHSWATLANYNNFQQGMIRDAMGHSSVKVTETYFRAYADEQIDGMNRQLMEAVFKSPQTGTEN